MPSVLRLPPVLSQPSPALAGRFAAASVFAQLIRLGKQVDRGDDSTIRGITFGNGTILEFPVLQREFDLESRPVPVSGEAPSAKLKPCLYADFAGG